VSTAGYDPFDLDAREVITARVLVTHPRSQCQGRDLPCCIHSPSDHRMRGWRMNWRDDTGVMERLCEHGVGHPDPDHLAHALSLTPEHECPDEDECGYPHLEWQSFHGCCPERCCAP
jgi:hypothetical protein